MENHNQNTYQQNTSYKPASRHFRLFAFVLDFFLITTFTVTLLWVFILPRYYGSEMTEFDKLVREHTQNVQQGKESSLTAQTKKFSPEAIEMIQFMQSFVFIMFWLYFALSELFMKGGSLGKKVFSLKVISTRTDRPMSFFDTFLRSGIKTMAIFTAFPILISSYLIYLFTKNYRSGHDFLARTVVIEDL